MPQDQNLRPVLAWMRRIFPKFYSRATPGEVEAMDLLVQSRAGLVSAYNEHGECTASSHWEPCVQILEQAFADFREQVRRSSALCGSERRRASSLLNILWLPNGTAR